MFMFKLRCVHGLCQLSTSTLNFIDDPSHLGHLLVDLQDDDDHRKNVDTYDNEET
jgi:hypothetical protein